MQIRRAIAVPILILIASVVTTANAQTYKVDAAHSSLVFKVKHLDTGFIWGRFNTFDGSVAMENGAPTRFEFSVNADSIDTGIKKRDDHLRSPDFFAAKEFPKITFKSTAVKPAGDNAYEVTGDLTLHGQTKSITVTVTKTGQSSGQQGEKVGFASSFTVRRSDFGMNFMVGPVSDEVELHLGTEMRKS